MSLLGTVRDSLADLILPRRFYFAVDGSCPCCGATSGFVATDSWLRDSFRCRRCGSIPRQRALMLVIDRLFPGWQRMEIHESSPSGGGASDRLRREAPGYLPTQFFPGHPPGAVVSGFRNEDLAHQTFADGSFDLVVTQDVMEHVYAPAAVFVEIARTLRPGGAHVFSVPLVNKHRPSEVWAVRGSDGAPRFLDTPEFHGNPVDPGGAPVTMHWGLDIVEHIRAATGLDTEIHTLDELAHGVRAEYNEILVTRKPA